MKHAFEPTPFDDEIRRELCSGPADMPIPGLAQRAMAIASARGQVTVREAGGSRWSSVITVVGISAIAAISILGWPAFLGLVGGDQAALDASDGAMTSGVSYLTWMVIAGAISFVAIICAVLSRASAEVSERMFLAA